MHLTMHITLRQLRIFEAVANHLSISRAAADLHLTQPAVSMQMKQLEEHLGVALTEQVGRRMTLSDAGREVRSHARDITRHMTELGTAMNQFRNVQFGMLVLPVESFPILRRLFVVHRTHKRLSAAAQTFSQLLLTLEPGAPVQELTLARAPARRPCTTAPG